MLSAIRENLDGLSEQEQGHYVEREGKFYLEVEAVDGVALENVTGLKTTVGKLRTTETALQKKIAELTDRFKDLDPEEARNALSKMDEIKNWDGDQKIQEAVEAAKRELVKQHKKEKEELENELSNTQDQLTDAIVDTKIVEALTKEEGNVTLLMPHVKQHVRMVKNADGKFIPEVINDAGEQRIGDSDGSPMTISQYIAEMKTQTTFAAGFPGANSTGSGRSSDEDRGKRTVASNSKTISASDGKALSGNIEDIASGKVRVDMEK
jgi:F0F1-type ATP synthase membrane subunit b/b'